MLLAAAALAGPPPELALAGPARIGARLDAVAAALGAAGAAPRVLPPDAPGALSEGLLGGPGLLALLHRAGAEEDLLGGLSATPSEGGPPPGPTLLVASLGGARAAYAFVDGGLVAGAFALPAASVAPAPDPFDPDRLARLRGAVTGLCRTLRPSRRDPYGNATAYAGAGCQGGALAVFLEPSRPDAAVQGVWWP